MIMDVEQGWTPTFFVDIDDNAQDSDYLRVQQCCTACGAYIGDLDGYFYIEDNDVCPNCRTANKEESWSDEVTRSSKRHGLPEKIVNEMDEYMDECTECYGNDAFCFCGGAKVVFDSARYANDKADEIAKLCGVTDKDVRTNLYHLVSGIVREVRSK